MEQGNKLPFFISLSQIIVGFVGFFFVLYIGQDIIIPLIFALIIAILLNPLVNYLHRKKFNRTVAIFIAVLLAFLCTAGILFFIGSQASMFMEALPQLKLKFHAILADTIKWLSDTFNVSTKNIEKLIEKQKSEGLNQTSSVIGQTLTTISGILIIVFLLPVYIFLFLFYKPLLLDFITQLFPSGKHGTVAEVLTESKTMIQSYLIGLLIEAGIVATLNSLGLFILGIEYALLLGVIGALLNLIPYIGGLVAISLPMILALATKDSVYAVYVLILYMVVQFIDNNFIIPKIVASKVKINALISIIVVLIGGQLWGIPGMFLALPLIAIIKVILDRLEPLKPWGFLLGDSMPQIGSGLLNLKPKKKIKSET